MQALQVQPKSGQELAATASAALAKATIEAKFQVALYRPRSVLNARTRMLEACGRKGFAEGARYKIKRGKKPDGSDNYIEGFTIRFAETAIQSWGNVDVSATIAYEDEDKRLVRISVVDLETNSSYTDEVVLNKTVERSKVYESHDVVGERLNSEGKTVFIVKATEDELLMKVNQAKSKSIRTSGLRLVPQDILDEAWDICQSTMAGEEKKTDPATATKKICDSFAALGVSPSELEKYLGHTLQSVSPKERRDLLAIWTAIKDGEASWADYMKKADDDTIDMGAPKPVEPKQTEPRPGSIESMLAKVTEIASLVDEAKVRATETAKAGASAEVVRETSKSTFPVSSASEGTPAEQVGAMIKAAGASFDDFVFLLKEEKQIAATAEVGSLEEISVQVLNGWIAKPKAFAAAIKIAKGIKR